MLNILIIHGAYGYPGENWFPWLKKELKDLGYNVLVPRFPTPENQTLESWMRVFSDYRKYLNEDSIVIGHSLGPAFLLNVLENLDIKIRAAFFVSGFTGLLNNPEFDEINKSFTDKSFDWNKIKNNCRRFHVFHGDDDPYVPLEKAREFAKNLNTNLNVIRNGGHLNEKSGYLRFDLLLEEIKNELY